MGYAFIKARYKNKMGPIRVRCNKCRKVIDVISRCAESKHYCKECREKH